MNEDSLQHEEPDHFTAWLEREDGTILWLSHETDSTIGRSEANAIVLTDTQISRNHALVRPQEGKGFLLMDLGSTNGTYLNQLKIHKPVQLRDRDKIEIGGVRMLYRESRFDADGVLPINPSDATVFRVTKIPCFLVLVDIIGFTQFSQGVAPEVLARDLEGWTSRISQIITKHYGVINQYLGDAVFAFWKEESVPKEHILEAMRDLLAEQKENSLQFRIVLHYGEARIGAGTFSGVDNIIGKQVNYLFRMERLCSSLRIPSLLSDVVVDQLDIRHWSVPVGRHGVKDFTGEHLFYRIAEESKE